MSKSETSQTENAPQTYNISVEKGKLIDQDTQMEIRIENGTNFSVELPPFAVFYINEVRTLPSKQVVLIPKDNELNFSIRQYEVSVKLEEDLMLKITKGKSSRLIPSKCTILAAHPKERLFDKEIIFNIEVDSLNRAYTVSYNRLFPNEGANNRNVFQVMHYERKPLSHHREKTEKAEAAKVKARAMLKELQKIKETLSNNKGNSK